MPRQGERDTQASSTYQTCLPVSMKDFKENLSYTTDGYYCYSGNGSLFFSSNSKMNQIGQHFEKPEALRCCFCCCYQFAFYLEIQIHRKLQEQYREVRFPFTQVFLFNQGLDKECWVSQMERYTMFLDWKDQHCENDYTTQSNLQIQCNPYQTTNGIFRRTRTKNFTICMETQKTPNSQSYLEKEKRSWRNQAPGLQTILQSYSHQDSMALAQKQKYRSMEQDRKPRDKPMHIWSPYF